MRNSIKSITMIVSILLMVLMLAACGGNAGSSGTTTTTLKVAFNQPESHPQYKAMESFGEKFYDRTDGAYEVEVSPNEILGAQRETVELVQSGTIAMSIVGGSLLENFNKDFSVFNLPYVFDSVDHQMSVVNDPEVVGDLYTSLEDESMIIAAAFHGGIRNVYNNEKPIETPEDLKGMKIRVMESDTNLKMMELMGGVGTTMGQGDVYTAIQSGVLDGGENNELIFNSLKHFEIGPYYSYTKHLMAPDYLLINSDVLNQMSEEHQEIFKEELSAAIDLEVQAFSEDVEEAITSAEENGAIFNEVDTELFRNEVEPLIQDSLTSDVAKELYEKIQELRD